MYDLLNFSFKSIIPNLSYILHVNVSLSNSREKEDLLQQSSEIRQKLQGKVNECLSLEKSRNETAKKLSETQLLIQQVGKNVK